jgi:delta-aminolevulinic acid dehydratase/porphobilinogen synthase
VTLESLLAMRRAGADILITYAAAEVAGWLKG